MYQCVTIKSPVLDLLQITKVVYISYSPFCFVRSYRIIHCGIHHCWYLQKRPHWIRWVLQMVRNKRREPFDNQGTNYLHLHRSYEVFVLSLGSLSPICDQCVTVLVLFISITSLRILVYTSFKIPNLTHSDWSVNNFIKVVYETFLKVQSEFSSQSTNKKLLIDNHEKTIYGTCRSACSSCRMSNHNLWIRVHQINYTGLWVDTFPSLLSVSLFADTFWAHGQK